MRQLLMGDHRKLVEFWDERDAARRRELEAADRRPPLREAEIKRLETEIALLVATIVAGTASADVTAAINERRAQGRGAQGRAAGADPLIERLKALRAVAPLLRPDRPAQARQILRNLGVDRIDVAPDGQDAWPSQVSRTSSATAPPSLPKTGLRWQSRRSNPVTATGRWGPGHAERSRVGSDAGSRPRRETLRR